MVERENTSEHVNYGFMEAIIRLPVEFYNSQGRFLPHVLYLGAGVVPVSNDVM
jgi:hypothetical protein